MHHAIAHSIEHAINFLARLHLKLLIQTPIHIIILRRLILIFILLNLYELLARILALKEIIIFQRGSGLIILPALLLRCYGRLDLQEFIVELPLHILLGLCQLHLVLSFHLFYLILILFEVLLVLLLDLGELVPIFLLIFIHFLLHLFPEILFLILDIPILRFKLPHVPRLKLFLLQFDVNLMPAFHVGHLFLMQLFVWIQFILQCALKILLLCAQLRQLGRVSYILLIYKLHVAADILPVLHL